MKKVLALALGVALLAGCMGSSGSSGSSMSSSSSSMSSSSQGSLMPEGTRTGLGIVASTSKSNPAADGQEGLFRSDITAVAVTLDSAGKVVDVRIDSIEPRITFDATGAFTGEWGDQMTTPYQTKREMGDNYGLRAASSIDKEWYEQIDALENWMIGKNTADILSMRTYQWDETHTRVPDVEELKSSVTIDVGVYLDAFQKAVDQAR